MSNCSELSSLYFASHFPFSFFLQMLPQCYVVTVLHHAELDISNFARRQLAWQPQAITQDPKSFGTELTHKASDAEMPLTREPHFLLSIMSKFEAKVSSLN